MSQSASLLLSNLSSNGKLRLTGQDRVRFVNCLFSNDVAKLAPGAGCRAAMLTVTLGGDWLDEERAEVLRVEAGEPRYGVDMGEDHLPMEAGLDDAISHTKGCYMGQEVIARATARGDINKKLVGLRLLDGEAP